MTILVDISQVMISNLMQSIKSASDVDEDLVRHMVLNSIRALNVKFGRDFGEVVICCDSGSFWRREVFPYYKAGRKKARAESPLDWKKIFGILDTIKREIDENFPYRVVQVPRAEADDVIAVLAAKDSLEHINNGRKVLVASGDHDFVQLQRYPNVQQWDPVNKKFVTTNDPYRFLREHVAKGDVGDGVPNFLSPDDVFVVGGRQRPVTRKVMDRVMSSEDPKDFCEDDVDLRRYERNRRMIDLSMVPDDVSRAVLDRFESQAGKDKSRMLGYFMEHRLSNLFGHINEF